jgi:hypothetical protein
MFFCAEQMIENYRNGTAESQSIWFWFLNFTGDILNVIGCVLGNQLPTQCVLSAPRFSLFCRLPFLGAHSLYASCRTGLAVVYLTMTGCVLVQCAYYNYWRPPPPPEVLPELWVPGQHLSAAGKEWNEREPNLKVVTNSPGETVPLVHPNAASTSRPATARLTTRFRASPGMSACPFFGSPSSSFSFFTLLLFFPPPSVCVRRKQATPPAPPPPALRHCKRCNRRRRL